MDKEPDNGLQRAQEQKRSALEEHISPGGIPLSIRVETARARLRRIICRIEFAHNGNNYAGTGFLIGPRWVLTNYHVVEPAVRRMLEWPNITLRFFDSDEINAQGSPKALHPNNPWLKHTEYHDLDVRHSEFKNGRWPEDLLDFAVLNLADPVGLEPMPGFCGQHRGWIPLSDIATVTEKAHIFIYQYPHGGGLAESHGNVLAFNHNTTRVRYDANTEHGSSGSPIFNENYRITALHHVGDPGSLVNPKARYNQGIPISRIAEWLKNNDHAHVAEHEGPPEFRLISDELRTTHYAMSLLIKKKGLHIVLEILPDTIKAPLKGPVYRTNSGVAILEVLQRAQQLALLERVKEGIDVLLTSPGAPRKRAVPDRYGRKPRPSESLPELYFPLSLGGMTRYLARKPLCESAYRMLHDNHPQILLVKGTPQSGRSYTYNYFHYLETKLEGVDVIPINLRQMAVDNPIVNAARLAEELNQRLRLQYPGGGNVKSNEPFKMEAFTNHLKEKMMKRRGKRAGDETKVVLFVDGFESEAATGDAVKLVSGLLDLPESGLPNLLFVLVGFDPTLLHDAARRFAAVVDLEAFVTADIYDFFEAQFNALRASSLGLALDEGAAEYATARVMVEGALNKSPNVARVAATCTTVYEEILGTSQRKPDRIR